MGNEPSFEELLKKLTEQYDLEEFRTLCATLDVDFDSLRGEGKAGKARELIRFLERRGRSSELPPYLNFPSPSKKSRSARGVSPTVSYALLTRSVPTAYCYQLTAEQYPLVSVRLDNTGEGHANTTVRLQAVIEGYTDPDIRTVLLPHGQISQTALLPAMRQDKIAALNEIQPARLALKITQHDPTERLILEQTEPISLLARDIALLAYRAVDGTTVDLSDYLAAWVTPHHFEVKKFLRLVADRHPQHSIDGYPEVFIGDSSRLLVREQARAIFNGLKYDAHLTYINSLLTPGEQDGLVTQRVRLPSESLTTGGSANCLDSAVLFASLLELSSLESILVLVSGHAFVGWRTQKGREQYEFVDTAMIGTSDFAVAGQAADYQYEQALAQGYGNKLFDPNGFLRLIDVAGCRQKGIKALE